MEPISPFFAEKKGKILRISVFKAETLFKKHLIIFFFFQTDFHACLGVESWFLKSVSDWRGQNNWVKLWMHSYFSTCLPVPIPSPFMSYSLPLPNSHWLGSPIRHHLKNRSSTAVGERHIPWQYVGALVIWVRMTWIVLAPRQRTICWASFLRK